MDPNEVQRMAGQVSQLLAARLGARGHTLAQRIASRHRALPRRVREAARELAEAEAKLHAPKLVKQLDRSRLAHAHQTCVGYLEPLGLASRVLHRLLDMAASLAFGLVLMGLIGLLVLR